MVYVLLAWCYLFGTAFLTGFATLSFFGAVGRPPRHGGSRRPGEPHPCLDCGMHRSVTGVVMAGLGTLLVYAQIFSLFAGVGAAANGLLLVGCGLCMVRFRRRIMDFLRERAEGSGLFPKAPGSVSEGGREGKRQRGGKGTLIVLVALVLIMAYGTSRGIMHVDTGLYHAQAIRWIEEYGVVPGLGNLHSRFAYNSSAFCLCALYSLRWIFGEPMHVVQGFFALLVAVKCAPLFGVYKGRKLLVSDFLRCGAIYYLTVLYGEMVSPATDYFAMLLVFYILISWLDLMEQGEKECMPYILLCLLMVAAVTVKLSTAPILVLACKPAAMLIRKGQWKQIGLSIALGFLVALPWLIRNVLISGWLLYPFTFPDLFNVDWKMEKGLAIFDSKEIQVYARGIYDVNLYDTPFIHWAGPWFAALKGLEKVWVALSALGTMAGCLSLGVGAAVLVKERGLPEKREGEEAGGKRSVYGDWMLYGAALLIAYLVWQFSAPLVRYGHAYVIAPPTAVFGFWYCRSAGKTEVGKKGFAALLLVFLAYKAVDLTGGMLERADGPWYIRQQTYGDFGAYTYQVDGITIYVPEERGQIGYDKFPSSPWIQEIELRGEGEHAGDIRYGFRRRQ